MLQQSLTSFQIIHTLEYVHTGPSLVGNGLVTSVYFSAPDIQIWPPLLGQQPNIQNIPDKFGPTVMSNVLL